jgi:hypothetical protein
MDLEALISEMIKSRVTGCDHYSVKIDHSPQIPMIP